MTEVVITELPAPTVVIAPSPSSVEVIQGVDTVVVTEVSANVEVQQIGINTVEIAAAGPQGPAGPGGADLVGSFSFGDANPHFIATLPAGSYVAVARITVDQTFDGTGASLSLGSNTDPDLFLPASQCLPSEAASYEAACAVSILGTTQVNLYIQAGAGASTGTGRFWLSVIE